MNRRTGIQADVVDIRSDVPSPGDLFLVDSNIWIWLTYPPATIMAQPYQAIDYPEFISRAGSVGATLAHVGTAFAEIAFRIENIEFEAYKALHPNVHKKAFRRRTGARRRVTRSIRASWEQMNQFSAPLDVSVSAVDMSSVVNMVLTLPLDGYDALFLHAAAREGIRDIISDDGDFAAVADIRLFTANRSVISAATAQGRLSTR